MPPERAQGQEKGLAAGQRADVFALGAILVEAMIGQRLSQDEINAHKEKLFGALIHSATLPSEFVRAVFKALAYDPRQRYPTAAGMLADLLPIAPPVGRVDRRFLDFGVAEPGVPLRRTVTAFNAGGDLLQGRVEVEGDWLQVSLPGGQAVAGHAFASNRQPVTVTALPERVRRKGVPTVAALRFVFPTGVIRVPCSIERPALPADIRVAPAYLQIRANSRGRASGTLLFQNWGEAPATVSLRVSPAEGVQIEPAEFNLDGEAERAVKLEWRPAGQAEHLRGWLHGFSFSHHSSAPGSKESQVEYLLEWRLDGERGGFIPVEVAAARGFAQSVASRFRRPEAGPILPALPSHKETSR
jgi:hypothetical protein